MSKIGGMGKLAASSPLSATLKAVHDIRLLPNNILEPLFQLRIVTFSTTE
jgi:hypothetical protein